MSIKRILPVLFILLAGLLAACGPDATLGEIKLASSVDDQGQPVSEATTFQPGETVYLSVELQGAYEGLESTATWKRAGETVATQTLAAPRAADSLDPLFLVFPLETGADWPLGDYRCEVFIPDQGTTTLAFTLK